MLSRDTEVYLSNTAVEGGFRSDGHPVGDQSAIALKIVRYLARNNVTGRHNVTVDTLKNRVGVPIHQQGMVEDTVRELVSDPDAPVAAYGGTRDAVRLTSIAETVAFIERHGGDVPFGLERDPDR